MAPLSVIFVFLSLLSTPSGTFKITGLSPQQNGVTVWTNMSGTEQTIRLNYTITQLFNNNSPVSGYYSDLRSSFFITGLKSDTWYGLHLSTVYKWRGREYVDPSHDLAFKTLSNSTDTIPDWNDNASSGVSSDSILMLARPIWGGFQLGLANRLTDVQAPVSAHVTCTCNNDQTLAGLYRFDPSRTSIQSRPFLINSTLLPQSLVDTDPISWAEKACESVCWSSFVTTANMSYVLDSQCTNLTMLFDHTTVHPELWQEMDTGQGQTTLANESGNLENETDHSGCVGRPMICGKTLLWEVGALTVVIVRTLL